MEKLPDYIPEPEMTFDEFYKKMMKDRTLILLPERMKGSEEFIKLAIETSEMYELDTKITRKDSHIAVNYSFDCAGDMDFLIPLSEWLTVSRSFTGIYGFEITISLDYYTHAEFSKGKTYPPAEL